LDAAAAKATGMALFHFKDTASCILKMEDNHRATLGQNPFLVSLVEWAQTMKSPACNSKTSSFDPKLGNSSLIFNMHTTFFKAQARSFRPAVLMMSMDLHQRLLLIHRISCSVFYRALHRICYISIRAWHIQKQLTSSHLQNRNGWRRLLGFYFINCL
jgi:hypothetical protein